MSGIIQVKMLGRFGNQLHQYAACRTYAQQIGARLEVPDWCGRQIFGLDDPPWSRELPEVGEEQLQLGQTNIRLGGYFMRQRWIDPMSRATLRQWFTVQKRWLDLVPAIPGEYIAVHCRRGDYVKNPSYATVSTLAYDLAIMKTGHDPDHVVWVTDDAPNLVEGVPAEISFLPDWLTLLRAAVLFRSNSSFSWWAAALGHGQVFSPLVEDAMGRCDPEFVEGNWPRIACMVDDLRLPE